MYPEQILEEPFRYPRLLGLERIDRYLSQEAAIIDRGDGSGYSLLESTLPLHAPGAAAEPAPLDLSLDNAGEHFRPRNPLVPLQIAKDPRQGLTLPDAGITLRPAGAADASPELVQGKAFFSNTYTDTDLLVSPEPQGAELFTVLRSASSPEQLGFELALPAGAELRSLGDGSARSAEIVRFGETLAQVAPPAAIDADGRSVPLELSVSSNALTINVPHRSGDFAYPLLVDPSVTEDYRYWREGSVSDSSGWYSQRKAGSNPFDAYFGEGTYGAGLYIQTRPGSYYATGDWAQWVFRAPGDSFAYRADYTYFWHRNLASTFFTQGLWSTTRDFAEAGHWRQASNPNGWSPSPRFGFGEPGSEYTIHCLGWDCGPGSATAPNGTRGNLVILGLSTLDEGHRSTDVSTLYTGGMAILMHDFEEPSVVFGPEPPTGWTDQTVFTPVATDSGLGVKRLRLQVDGQPSLIRTHSCVGDRFDRCPRTVSPDDPGMSGDALSTGALPEGVRTVVIDAQDLTGNWSNQVQRTVKIDRTPPAVDLAGSLPDVAGETLTGESYGLTIDAKDGDATAPTSERAGIRSVEVLVDDQRQDYVDQSCMPGSCAIERSWTFHTVDYAPGDHTVRVVATDQLGHQTDTSFTVSVGEIQPGEESSGPESCVPSDPLSIDCAFAGPDPVQERSLRIDLAIQFRQDFGLRADREYVSQLESQSAQYQEAGLKYGLPLTAAEMQDLDSRQAVEAATDIIQEFGDTTARSTFAGFYIDQRTGGTVRVGFTADAANQLQALKQLFPYPDKLASFAAPYTEDQLEAFQNQIGSDLPSLESLGVYTVGLSFEHSAVAVGAIDPTPNLQQELQARYPGMPIRLEQSGVPRLAHCDTPYGCLSGQADRYDDYPVPPMLGALRIFRTSGGGAACSGGFIAKKAGDASRNYVLTAGHCGGLDSVWYHHQSPVEEAGSGPYRIGVISKRDFHNGGRGDEARIILNHNHRSHKILATYQSSEAAINILSRQAGSVEGELSCKSGYATESSAGPDATGSGVDCGKVTDAHIRVNYDPPLIYDMTKARIYACQGDSGGPVYSSNKAKGIVSGITNLSPSARCGSTTFYAKLLYVEDDLNVRVLTD
jgi:hypothetical protein